MKTIILNQTNATVDESVFEYTLPGSATFKETDQIAISSVQLFYSWFNITSELNNNEFEYIFPTSSGTITRSVIIPDGFYTLSDLNSFLQSVMVSNGDYAKDINNRNVYFLQISENQTAYSVQFDCFPVPTSAQATALGYTQAPSGGYPVSASTPQIVIEVNNFQTYTGFIAGTYPITPQSSTYSVLSQNTPEVSHVNTILLNCNIVNNPLAIPSNIIYAFTPNARFGSIISPNINELIWNTIQKGSYETLRLQFLNELYQPIKLRDSSVIIQLVVKSVE
jgi:hypothetical protein